MICFFGKLRVLAVVFLCLTAIAAAQETSGIINGRVTDESGAIIPGVGVTLTSPAIQGQRESVTGESGAYQFPLLPPGTYTVTFQLPGFKTLVREGIVVEVQRTTTINVRLDVATVAETVTVSGESPVVDVQNATVGVNFNYALLQNLPQARDIWGTLSQTPGVKVTTPDVGGSKAGNQSSYRTYGVSGQNWVNIDGVVVTQGTSAAGGYFDYATFQEIQIAGAANSAEVPVPGTFLNAVIKTGGNDFHGEAYANFQNDSFQSTNVTSELSRPCVTGDTGPCGLGQGDKFTHYYDLGLTIGGPIKRDKLWWFAAYRNQYSGLLTSLRKADGTPGGLFSTGLQFPTLKLTYQLNQKNALSFTGQMNRKFQPRQSGSGPNAAFLDVNSTGIQLSWNWIQKYAWTSVLTGRSTLDVSFNSFGFHFFVNSRVPDQYSTRDLGTQLVRGGFSGGAPGFVSQSSPGPFRQQRRRLHWNGNLSHFRDNFITGSHSFKFGYGVYWEDYRLLNKGFKDQVVLYYQNTVPSLIETFNTPFRGHDSLIQNAAFIQDKWQVDKKLTLNLGIRFDRYTNYYPNQENPGTSPWYRKTSFKKTHLSTFNNLVPRLSVVYDFRGDGRTAVKASYGRYSWNTSHMISSLANPNTAEINRYQWDGTLPFVPDPSKLVLVRGGVARSVDPNLTNSYTDEYTAGIDQQLFTDFGLRFNWVRKIEHDVYNGVNVEQDVSRYVPVSFVDPGRDGVRGNSDDRTLTVFNILPQYRGLSREVVMNFPGVGSHFTTFEIEATKRLSRGWQMITGIDWTKRNLNQDLSFDPNTVIYGPQSGTHYWEWTYKLSGTYDFVRGFSLSSVYKAQKGEPYERRLNVTGLNQGTIQINAEPSGVFSLPTMHVLDISLKKSFKVREHQSLEALFDIFNTLNASTILGVSTLTGPTFGRSVTQILNPRIFRLAARYSF